MFIINDATINDAIDNLDTLRRRKVAGRIRWTGTKVLSEDEANYIFANYGERGVTKEFFKWNIKRLEDGRMLFTVEKR